MSKAGSSEEIVAVSWACPWCRAAFAFDVKVGNTVALAKREATCEGCGARVGMELQGAGDGAKLQFKRLAQGRAGRMEIQQVGDALAVSLGGRPLATGDELELRDGGAWHPIVFAWDGSGDGVASAKRADGSEAELDEAALLRWRA